MGKTIKKNQTQRNVRGVGGSRYVVKGKAYAVENANSASIADHMVDNGYRNGARARWNGAEYILNVDWFGDASLARVAADLN